MLPEESDAGRTLCYEDRDGAAGLHRWWDGLVAVYAGGVRLEAWVRLLSLIHILGKTHVYPISSG